MHTLDAEARGPQDPLRATPPRRPGSIRRTATLDASWPDGFAGDLLVRGRARDLVTATGAPVTVADVALELRLDAADRAISSITGPDAGLDGLVGVRVGRGFRAAVAGSLPHLEHGGSPLRLLLDDLPGAVLVSGYAVLAGGVELGARDPSAFESQADICAGWVREGALLGAIRETGQVPTPVGPPSPPLEDPDDPAGWHPVPPPVPTSTRRRRLLDVCGTGTDGSLRVTSLFRDSHADDAGVERSFHEYEVGALLHGSDHRIEAIVATPRVLPWRECPAAIGSAGRLVGLPVAGARARVRETFRGPSTCTHLDDVLCALADVSVLCERLRDAGAGPHI